MGKRIKRRYHLKHYLIIITSSLIVIPTVTLILLATLNYSRLYEEQTINYCKHFALEISTSLTNSLDYYERKIDDLAADETFRGFFQQNRTFNGLTYDYIHLMDKYFPNDSLERYYLQEIDCYIFTSGYCLTYGSNPTEITDIEKSSYYQKALEHPNELNWVGYDKKSDAIEITRLLYDPDSYVPVGLIIIRQSQSFFQDTLSKYDREIIENIFIFNNNNTQLYPSDYVLNKKYLKSEGVPIDSSERLIIPTQLQKTSAKYPYDQWTVIVNVTKTELLKNYRQMTTLFVIITIIILFVSITITAKLAVKITAPIEKLADAMTSIREGHLNAKIETSSQIYEISDMYDDFNQMAYQLNQLVNTVYKARLAQKESQIIALQAQINPHFLFNTLQLISLKAYEYEADDICHMISSLSYMLSSNLYGNKRSHYLLCDELEYINHYMYIIKEKYKDKICFELQISPDTLQCAIPQMVIQPFVENAVIHGISPKTGNGNICISTAIKNDSLIVTIHDDGIGIQADILEKINTNMDLGPADAEPKKGHHIALNNVKERIKLLYGGGYGFLIDSALYTGTTVTLTLPDIKKGRPNNDKSIVD